MPDTRNSSVELRPQPLIGALLIVCIIGGIVWAEGQTGERIVWHTARRLDQELSRPVNIVLNRTTPRQVVQRLRELHHVALLLDRRIDPDRSLDVQFTQTTLGEALQTFALQLNSELARIGGTLFIGPPQSTDRIRTLIALRTSELKGIDGDDALRRQSELLRGTTLSWDDLAEPAALIEDIAAAFHVKRSPEVSVPHDLWGAGVMADVNAVEALSLLLGEFDLTFDWQDQAAAIRIVPAPASVTIRQEHTSVRMEVAEALTLIREEFPYLRPQAAGRSITLAATVGEHEAIAAILDPRRSQPATPEPTQGPLSRRRFTLTATRVEAIAVLRTLETQDVDVDYDPDQLQQAGINLRTKISLELDQATADELFTQLCDPLGLHFEIDGKTVRLTPKTSP